MKLIILNLNQKLYYLFIWNINKTFSVFVKIKKMPPLVTILYQIKSKELNKDFINRLASYNEIFKTFYYNFIGFIINKYFIFTI